MQQEMHILLTTAASLGFFHTLFGPDHYLPFIVMGKAGKWSMTKTMVITFLCGLGHVASSVLLGYVGIAMGYAVTRLEIIESFRGNLAAWGLIAFGLLYMVWGIRRAVKNKPHTHLHLHADGQSHFHEHQHYKEHAHAHTEKKKNLTPWVLFVIFVLGPCEPLIPLLMYPATKFQFGGVLLVAAVFALVTVVTMMSVVYISILGFNYLPLKRVERYMHAIAGGTIFLSGMAIQVLGL